jgi:hypothetical protein
MAKISQRQLERVLVGFANRNWSEDHSNLGPQDLDQMQVSALCVSHQLAVVPSHGMKDGRCTCDNKNCEHPGRHPRTPRGLEDATIDRELTRQFWTRWPKAKVIVATGQQGIIAVTVRGQKGRQALDRLADPDEAPSEPFKFQGRCRRIYLCRVPEHAIPNGRVRLAEGVVVHGRGSFIVVPRNVTRPGRYKQLYEREIGPAPSWLLKLLGAPAPPDTPHLEKDGANAMPSDGSEEDTASPESQTISEGEEATAHERPAISERTFPETLDLDTSLVEFSWISIPDGSPPCDDNKVRALAESYRITDVRALLAVRLLTLRTEHALPTFRLLSDPHQLEALKHLGITCASCLVIKGEVDERLWKLADLIHGPDLKRLDWALLVMEWVVRAKGAQVAHPRGGKQPHDKGFSAAERVLGICRRDLGRAERIASISAEAQQEIRRAALDDIERALLEIASEPPEQQVAKALELKERYRKPRRVRATDAATNANTRAQTDQVPEPKAPSLTPDEDESDQAEDDAAESPAIAPADASGDVDKPSALQPGAGDDERFETIKLLWEQHIVDEWTLASEAVQLRFLKEVLEVEFEDD